MEEINELIKTIEDYEPVFIREKESLGMEEAMANVREEIYLEFIITLQEVGVKSFQAKLLDGEIRVSDKVKFSSKHLDHGDRVAIYMEIKYGEDILHHAVTPLNGYYIRRL